MHRLAAYFSVFATVALAGSTMVAGVLLNPDVAQAKTGEEIFLQSGCNACHTVGGGRLIGPDLLGVSERRSEEWLVKFVQHSQAMVEAGDPVAVALFEEHNKVVMPDQVLTKAEILAVVEYAKTPRIIGTAQPAAAGRIHRRGHRPRAESLRGKHSVEQWGAGVQLVPRRHERCGHRWWDSRQRAHDRVLTLGRARGARHSREPTISGDARSLRG